MESIRSRMIMVLALVCVFAVGMATLLNYFKYRTTAESLVNARLVVIGKSIENSVQASLSLGIPFSNIRSLTSLLERERDADELVFGIEIFNAEGQIIYSTDQLRVGRKVQTTWLNSALQATETNWVAQAGSDSALGIALKNSFGVIEGYLALRYTREPIDAAAYKVGQKLLISALGVLLVAMALGAAALSLSVRRVEREMETVEATLRDNGHGKSAGTLFGNAVGRFLETVRAAETNIAAVRGKLTRG